MAICIHIYIKGKPIAKLITLATPQSETMCDRPWRWQISMFEVVQKDDNLISLYQTVQNLYTHTEKKRSSNINQHELSVIIAE